jgi:hypothetical protein
LISALDKNCISDIFLIVNGDTEMQFPAAATEQQVNRATSFINEKIRHNCVSRQSTLETFSAEMISDILFVSCSITEPLNIHSKSLIFIVGPRGGLNVKDERSHLF